MGVSSGGWISHDAAGFEDGPNLYAYVKENPWSAFDPHGLDAFATADATNPNRVKVSIEIPVAFDYEGERPEKRISEFKRGIENKWKGKVGKYNVTTRVTEPSDGRGNKITISNEDGNRGQNASYVMMLPGWDRGKFKNEKNIYPPGEPTTNEKVASHEAGHMMGLKDRYTNVKAPDGSRETVVHPGYEDNIMGQLNGKPSEQDITEILSRARKPSEPTTSAKETKKEQEPKKVQPQKKKG